jgi:hypothetical protein
MVSTDTCSKELVFNCEMNSLDVTVNKGKYVSIACNLPSIDEDSSTPDYKDFFEITPDGDYRFLVEFKSNPERLRIYSQIHETPKPIWDITISGW